MGINNEMHSFYKMISEKEDVLTHVLKLLKSIDCYQFDFAENTLFASCEPGMLYFEGDIMNDSSIVINLDEARGL